MAELAAVALLSILAVVAWRIFRRPDEMPEAKPEKLEPLPPLAPEVPPDLERARSLRAEAVKRCDREEWQGCLDALKDAARLDPAGDTAKDVAEMRGRATKALELPAPSKEQLDQKLAPPAPTVGPKSELDEKSVTPKPPPTFAPTSTPPPVPTSFAKPKAPAPTEATPSKAPPSKKSSGAKSGFDFDSK